MGYSVGLPIERYSNLTDAVLNLGHVRLPCRRLSFGMLLVYPKGVSVGFKLVEAFSDLQVSLACYKLV